jgi:hypothetical protein
MVLRSIRPRSKWVFAACAVLGCGSSSAPSPPVRVFTGQVDGTDVRVAVIATVHHARVYFCGGDSSYATATQWFPVNLPPSGQVASPQPVDGGPSFDGQIGDDIVRGSLVFGDGGAHAFAATPVASGTIGGLYETTSPCGHVGLIVAQSSAASAPVGQGACIGSPAANGASPVEQVTPLRPLARAANGTIRVTIAGSAEEVSVGAAAAPAE